MRRTALALLTVSALAAGCAHAPVLDREAEALAVGEILDGWHGAAANADLEAYLGAMAPDAVFLGTDGTERWTARQFADFVEPYFSKGTGWTYRPGERHVTLSRDGRTAWFDERLFNDGYGELRGTGVAVRTPEGWRIAQYNMTFVLPNDATREVVRTVRSRGMEGGGPPGSLPAGTWFSTTTYGAVCDGCPRPGAAIVSGFFETEEECGEALRKLSTIPMQIGYPLVIHTDELAPAKEDLVGIAVVLGLFEDRAGATAWLGQMGQLVGTARVIALLDREAAYDRAYAPVEAGETDELVQTRLVRIQAGRPVAAYRAADIDEYQDEHGIAPIPHGAVEPACEVEPGAIFAIRDRSFNHRYYSHAPVRCPDGSTALVDWRETLLDTATGVDGEGRGILSQVVGAECDSPLVETWYYDDRGRYRMADGEME